MPKYLDKLENKFENKKIGKILFNKYYNLRDFCWMFYYLIAFGALAGIGNSLSELNSGLKILLPLFWQGFLNNSYLSILITIIFAKSVNLLSTKKHFRLNVNIFNAIIMVLFLLWHYIIGTENPLQAMVLPALLSLFLINHHVSAVKNKK